MFRNIGIILIILLALFIGWKNIPQNHSKTFQVMGTYATITVNNQNPEKYIKAAYQRLKAIEKKMNRFDPKSEISLVNRIADVAQVYVSDDLYKCLKLARKVSDITDGAFDITLDGNYRNIVLDDNKKTISFSKPGIKINLDGIAKGFGVEEARLLLFKMGVKSGMINMTSSIAVVGGNWKIGIKNPLKENDLLEVISLNTQEALSTSGNYEQGNHILDPKTQKPVNSIVSLTIWGQDAGFLDGLSTGLFVLGSDKARRLVKKLGLHMTMLAKDRKIIKI